MRAFLSSTFVDLIEYRRVAAEALFRLDQQVGRMEVFGARPSEAKEACLDEIEAAEIFVGIYAHRYGFTPDPNGISITEQEFDHALAHRKRIFCFMVDDDFPWPPKMIEGEPGRGRLLAFKERIGRMRVRDTFTTPENLGLRVATSIGRYISVMGSVRQSGHSLSPSLPLASVAGAAVAQTVAMVFVDLMRLLYVVSSDAAREANAQRYDAFVGMAKRHLEDLRSSLAQFATALDATAHHRSVAIQRRFSWMLDQLDSGVSGLPKAGQHWQTMRDTADAVDEFCTGVAADAYATEVEAVRRIVSDAKGGEHQTPPPASLDELFHLRLAAQSLLLERSRVAGESNLFSIADDMEQRFGIRYFLIDRLLLNGAAAVPRRAGFPNPVRIDV